MLTDSDFSGGQHYPPCEQPGQCRSAQLTKWRILVYTISTLIHVILGCQCCFFLWQNCGVFRQCRYRKVTIYNRAFVSLLTEAKAPFTWVRTNFYTD